MRHWLPPLAVCVLVSCSFSGAPPTSGLDDSGADVSAIDGAAAKTDAQAKSCADVPSGALAWWDGEELGVDRLNNFPMTSIFESPTVGLGLVGNAMILEDDDDIVFNPGPQASQFTVEGWIRRDADDVGYQTIYGNGNEAGLFLRNHRLVFYDSDAGNMGQVVIGATETVLGQYHHVAVTYDGAQVAVFFGGEQNGVVATAVDIALPAIGRVGGVLFNVGDGDGNDFVGQVDELTVYDRHLSGDEIAAIAEAGALGKCKE